MATVQRGENRWSRPRFTEYSTICVHAVYANHSACNGKTTEGRPSPCCCCCCRVVCWCRVWSCVTLGRRTGHAQAMKKSGTRAWKRHPIYWGGNVYITFGVYSGKQNLHYSRYIRGAERDMLKKKTGTQSRNRHSIFFGGERSTLLSVRIRINKIRCYFRCVRVVGRDMNQSSKNGHASKEMTPCFLPPSEMINSFRS